MKKIFIMLLLALMALTCLNTLPRANAQTKPKTATTTAKAPKATTIMGMVSADEKSFVNDKDKKSWTVENPVALKGHAGHHVSVTATVDADKNEITVKSVKMLTAKAKTPKTPTKKAT